MDVILYTAIEANSLRETVSLTVNLPEGNDLPAARIL